MLAASGLMRKPAMPRLTVPLLAALLAVGAPAFAAAQDAGQNDANNPLTPKITLNLQDYYVGDLSGVPNTDANQFLLRGLLPHKIGGPGQLFRFTLPIVTTPTGGGHTTDVGDLTVMDLFVVPKGHLELGGGPLLVAPTAGEHATGAGKWQAGAAGILIAPQKWGLLGGLVTYQHSFAGDSDRADVSLMTLQPLVLYNLPKGWYLRSTATWTFDFEGDTSYIPIGAGFGKVFEVGGVTLNAFVEPQITAWKDNGVGVPNWQAFVGLNMQFPLKR